MHEHRNEPASDLTTSIRNTVDLILTPKWLPVVIVFAILYSGFLSQYFWEYRGIANVDLPSFYTASIQVFQHGESPYDRDVLQSRMAQEVHVLPYLYPPPSLLFFWPFSFLEYDTARHAVLVINHLLILVLLWFIPRFLLRRPEGISPHILMMALIYILTFHPIVVTLNHGQVNLLLLGFLCGFWVLCGNKKLILASFFLSAAIVLKTYPLIIIPLLLITGHKRTAFYTILWLGVLVSFSVFVLPSTIWVEWLTKVMPSGGYGRIPAGLFSPADICNQSLNGFFARAYTKNNCSNPAIVNPALARCFAYITSGLVSAVTAFAAWKGSKLHLAGLNRTLIIALPAIYLIAPFAWEHHLVYLLPSVLLLLAARSTLPLFWKFCFHTTCVISAIIIASPTMLQFKFYAVIVLWYLCVFTACSTRISLPNDGMEEDE